MRSNRIRLKDPGENERLAQIIADFLRKRLLTDKKKFSFETVFSHPSKLDIMRQAVAAGYKVYLYFVSTESPKINKFRVAARKKKGGHDVPPEKIESRYYRSLDLLYEASQLCYRAYYFDNSVDRRKYRLFAQFLKVRGGKKWDIINPDTANVFPRWFIKYYSKKIPRKK